MSATTGAIDRVPGQVRRRQLLTLAGMVGLYALAAFCYVLMPGGALDPSSLQSLGIGSQGPNVAPTVLALANAGIVLAAYNLLGLLGYWLSSKAALPGIFRPGAGWRRWVVRPLAIGAGAGVALVACDLAAQRLTGYPGFAHPVFPASIAASLAAGIGEEVLTRLVVLSLWAAILTWLLGKLFPGRPTRRIALRTANVIAALVFAASHFPGLMMLAGVTSPAALPPAMLVEVIFLNAFLGILAGEALIADGLVAASGIHFWADIVWHVIYGLVA